MSTEASKFGRDRPIKLLWSVNTRNRPNMLAECMRSVLEMEIPGNIQAEFLIVDNSEDETVRVRNREALLGLPGGDAVTLLHESRLGAPFGWNRGIETALERQADVIVILDDDQTVPPDWLAVVARVAREENADVVKSRVDWLLAGEGRYAEQFEGKKRDLDGAKRMRDIRYVSTNGVWVSTRLFREFGLRFDEARALKGATDTKLFTKAYELGARMVETHEVSAFETVPMERQTVAWLLKRSFRGGQSRAQLGLNRKGRIHYFASGLLESVLYGSVTLLLLWSPVIALKKARRTAKAFGCLWGALGGDYEEYRKMAGS